jgi:hypothetical protein
MPLRSYVGLRSEPFGNPAWFEFPTSSDAAIFATGVQYGLDVYRIEGAGEWLPDPLFAVLGPITSTPITPENIEAWLKIRTGRLEAGVVDSDDYRWFVTIGGQTVEIDGRWESHEFTLRLWLFERPDRTPEARTFRPRPVFEPGPDPTNKRLNPPPPEDRGPMGPDWEP